MTALVDERFPNLMYLIARQTLYVGKTAEPFGAFYRRPSRDQAYAECAARLIVSRIASVRSKGMIEDTRLIGNH